MVTIGMTYPVAPTVTPVICVRDAYKSYGSQKVLNGLDLTVYPGTIYALLGPSGCGKTTLISSIVGRGELDSGSISSTLHDINDIGFMPQEIALFKSLSITEVMRFYGLLYGMDTDEITRRVQRLSDMLELPPSSRCICTLSGGQQRRVSLSVALLHDPKVIILDEPTVGLDPVISKNLWDRLKEMSHQGKTIILSTHYIEEARQADMIGLMRKGRMLTQDSPNALLEKYNVEYLEDVFLALCYQDNEASPKINSEKQLSSSTLSSKPFSSRKTVSLTRINAVLWKNFYITKRNIMVTLFNLLMPLIMDGCTKIALSHDPYHLPLAVINGEFESSLLNCPRSFTNSCVLTNNQIMASCVFLSELRNRTYEMTEFVNYEDALSDHRKNRNRGIVQFPSNFSATLSEWILEGSDSKHYKHNPIQILIDNTEMQIRQQLQKDVLQAYQTMIAQTVEVCTDLVMPRSLTLPLQIQDPVFGDKSWNFFTDFSIGFNTVGILFCTMIFAAATLLDEKTEGSLDRVLAVGVSIWDIMIGHIIQHSIFAVLFGMEAYIVMYPVLDQPLKGSSFLIIAVFIITGLTGVFLGGAVGLVTQRLIVAVNAVSGFNFAFMSLTGLIWPVEGAHESLKPIIPYVPLTSTFKLIRDIAFKGYDLTKPMVVKGFSQIILLLFVSLLAEIFVIKMQRGAWGGK